MNNNQLTQDTKSSIPNLKYKNSCYGRNCYGVGTNQLKVLYINKIGWFCDTCTQTLKDLELVEVIN
jgi:hypothetical protein